MRLYDFKGHRAGKFRSGWYYCCSLNRSLLELYIPKKKRMTKNYYRIGHEKQEFISLKHTIL